MNLHQVTEQALTVMAQEGLTRQRWGLRWGNARRSAGSCNYRARIITLSRPLLSAWTPEQATNTVMHEIAHALTPGSGHGPAWQAKCRELGIVPERCWAAGDSDRELVPLRYAGKCGGGHGFSRMRLPASARLCLRCHRYGLPESDCLITWSPNPFYGAVPARENAADMDEAELLDLYGVAPWGSK